MWFLPLPEANHCYFGYGDIIHEIELGCDGSVPPTKRYDQVYVQLLASSPDDT